MAEWGMWGFQSSFPCLKDKIIFNERVVKTSVKLMVLPAKDCKKKAKEEKERTHHK
jgi:hypothetical protein